MVVNVGTLRSRRYDYVEDDVRRVVEAAGVKLLERCAAMPASV